MASERWAYSPATGRYRDLTTGRFLTPTRIEGLKEQVIGRMQRESIVLGRRLANGDLSVQDWEAGMQAIVRQSQTMEYLFGRGGRNAATSTDRAAIAVQLHGHWAYLHGFAAAVAAGTLSPAQVAARSALYLNAARTAYERGRAASFGLSLPAYPGEGTVCHTNCRCTWAITDTPDGWACTWTLHSGESCQDCQARAARWSPLVMPRQPA